MQDYGTMTYVILFLIVFCETGLVVTPFLPGDSLLFAAGALAPIGGLNIGVLAIILFIAAVLGDTVNYSVGKFIGPKVFDKKDSKIFRKEYLEKTQSFYDRYGAKTIVIARFVPIVRTFAPFLAGVGSMNYSRFIAYNIGGALLWVGLFVSAGFFFGEIPVVKNNFTIVIMAIIVLSILPAVIEVIRVKKTR
jgi:membrane-associated protein